MTTLTIGVGCILLLLVLVFTYQYYNAQTSHLSIIDTFEQMTDNGKPFLWIYVPHEYNSRKWHSFYSRTSHDLNQPYLLITSQSIVMHCYKSFNLCFVTDDSFAYLLPDWSVTLNKIPKPVKGKCRELGLMKLLYKYGGALVPIEFCALKDLYPIYMKAINTNKWIMFETKSTYVGDVLSNKIEEPAVMPNYLFSFTNKQNETIESFIVYLMEQIAEDYTDESSFTGIFNKWCESEVKLKNIIVLDGKLIGIKTINNELINTDYLFYTLPIELQRNNLWGIQLPRCEILNSRNHQVFALYEYKQIKESPMKICEYLNYSITSDNDLVLPEIPVKKNPGWVGFWDLPGNIKLYGLKPNYLGNHLIFGEYSSVAQS